MTNEILEKLKAAKSAEELIEMAKANGAEITAEDAQKLFSQISDGELSDENAENLAGGYRLEPGTGGSLGFTKSVLLF